MPFSEIRIEKQILNYDSRLDQRDSVTIDMVVVHCTELPSWELSRQYGEKILYPSGTGNSGHFYIGKDGRAVQYVNVDRIAHHAMNYNERSIGIELLNSGRFPYWFHSQNQEMTDPYPSSQIEALIALIAELRKQYPSLKYLGRHDQLDQVEISAEDDPSIQIRRKVDPGPLFPWDLVLSRTSLADFREYQPSA